MAGASSKVGYLYTKSIETSSQAANDSAWYHALELQDCKALLALLQENPCLVVKTGPEGWTVLHAAAQRGCLELIQQVFDLFDNRGTFEDKMSGVKVSLQDLLIAKCGNFEVEAYNMAWFTCARRVLVLLRMGVRINRVPTQSNSYWNDIFASIEERHVTEGYSFEKLKEGHKAHENNFELNRRELLFHYACGKLRTDEGWEYVNIILDGCMQLEQPLEVTMSLWQLHNAQGQTPLHVAMTDGCLPQVLGFVLEDVEYKKCLNAKDVRGWTILYYATATRNHCDLVALLQDERIDVNARTGFKQVNIDEIMMEVHNSGRFTSRFSDDNAFTELWEVGERARNGGTNYGVNGVEDEPIEAGMTALHLAILHKDVRSVKLLLKWPHIDVNALLYRHIIFGYESNRTHDDEKEIGRKGIYWSPLQLATLMGQTTIVRALLQSKLCSFSINESGSNPPLIFLASASGNPDTLRFFLDDPIIYKPLVRSEESATTLHYAANAMPPTTKVEFEFIFGPRKVDHLLLMTDFGELDPKTSRYEEELNNIKLSPKSYLGRQACITMLLQAGIDIWEKDDQKRLAEPGPHAPEEAILWWHEKMARETMEAKTSLTYAANAISVVAALVATASYVGPLQPPLGYGGDSVEGGVQDNHLSIRVFMVSNNLSFYLAVTSILFAVVPSLPISQEGIYAEWQRTRTIVGIAIFFLLMSVLGVLISFGVASNSVVSKDYSWRHDGLSFYPTLLGGFICIVAIILFFLRLLRMVFNENTKIRFWYKKFVKF